MANSSKTITLPKTLIRRKEGVVILPLKEYRKLLEKSVPTYYLSGKEAEKADKIVEQGLKEHREGKTIRANSLKEALKEYEKESKR